MKRLDSRAFELKGGLQLGENRHSFTLPIKTPHLFAIDLLKHLLKKHGITLKGSFSLKKSRRKSAVLATWKSHPLSELIKPLLKKSDNLYADALFKKIGQFSFGSPGTWKKGRKAVEKFLKEKVGLNPLELVIVDGSGLSCYNLISPYQITYFLSYIHHLFPYSIELKEALAISG